MVEPAWPFPEFAKPDSVATDLPKNASPRERLAALVTEPNNEQFAQVIANRVWKQLMGRGLVDPVDDWEKAPPSHPDLLRHLGRELVRENYDLKRLVRSILTSHAYQRAAALDLTEPDPNFAARAHRRLSAEQLVDSLFHATGNRSKPRRSNWTWTADAPRPIRSTWASRDAPGSSPLEQAAGLALPKPSGGIDTAGEGE